MIEKLRELKKKSHMTNQQIAEKSNIPESTVARIFSGKTPNPTVSTVISMARAMGASPADLIYDEDENPAEDHALPMKSGEDKEIAVERADTAAAPGEVSEQNRSESSALNLQLAEIASSHEKFYEDIIGLYKNEMKKKDRWIARLFWCLAGVVLFILLVLIFDITHPNFGFVKY